MISGAAGAKTEPVKLIVLDPTGAKEITHLFAPRLPDLNGKVIAELAVDPTKWQPHRTMPYIEALLKKAIPRREIHRDAGIPDGAPGPAKIESSRW